MCCARDLFKSKQITNKTCLQKIYEKKNENEDILLHLDNGLYEKSK